MRTAETDKRFVMDVPEKNFCAVMSDRKQWKKDVRTGMFASRWGVNIFEHTMAMLGYAAKNNSVIAWEFVKEFPPDREESFGKMAEMRRVLMRVLRQRMGRNFEWRTGHRSWQMADSFVSDHQGERDAVMEVVSAIRMIERIDLWLGWHNGHSYDGGKEL